MARIGINPARGKVTDHRPAPVTVTMLTYIPYLSGYFEHRLEVLKLVFASLFAHTTSPYDLLVFDNGSCSIVIDYLRKLQHAEQSGYLKAIDYLILSPKNIGKIDALKIMFNAAPGEIIAYNDDDILFYPGWLEAHLEIFKYFPKAGMVSGIAVRNAAEHARKSLDKLAAEGAAGLTSFRERRIRDDWEADWALSTGRDPQVHMQATHGHMDLVLRQEKPGNQGVIETIGSANHFQFVSPRQVILQALPAERSGKLMGSMIELDEAIDNLGYLRLSTVDRFTRHLGNTLSDAVVSEAKALGLPAKGNTEEIKAPLKQETRRIIARKRHWFLRMPGGRRILTRVYDRIFDILYR
jgi:glycosyltransferase involved in cell wall biosynthesis